MPFFQPGRQNSGINRMFVISLLVHTVVISAMLFTAKLPSKKLTFGPVYDVNLVSSPMQSVSTKSSAPISSEIKSIPKSQPVTLKKQETIRETPAVRKDDGRQVQRAIDDIRKKVSAATPQASAPPSQSANSAESSSRMDAYYALIWSRIKSQWALPRGIVQRDNLEAVIEVKITRDGRVSSLGIEKSSGNRYFDDSAIKAVRKASPFPPLPAVLQASSAEFGIRFHSSEGH